MKFELLTRDAENCWHVHGVHSLQELTSDTRGVGPETRKFKRKVSQPCDLLGLSRHDRKSCFNPSLDIESCQALITSLSGRPIEECLQCNSRVASQDVQQSAFASAGWPHDGRQFS